MNYEPTFLNDVVSNQYFIYLAVALGILISYAVKNHLNKKEQADSETLRELENEAYLQGVNYLLSKETDKAIEEFIRAVKINPDTVATYFALGTLFRNKGEYSKAVRVHQSIIARPNIDKDTKSQALYNLGRDYKKAGMVQKGIDILESLSKTEKYKVEALYKLQELYEDLKDWDNAIRIVKEITKLENKNKFHILAHLYTEKAKSIFEDGNELEAKKIFKKAISLDSHCIDAFLHLGDLYFSQENYLKSINTWKQVLDINSFFTHLAYPRLEEAYFRLGKYENIEKLLKNNLAKNKNDIYCYLALGRYYINKGDLGEAAIELQEALNIEPNFIDAKKELGNIYLKNNMIDEIKNEFKNYIQVSNSRYSNYVCKKCGYIASEIMWKCPQCRKWDSLTPEDRRKLSRSPNEQK
ncbi:tetratricopeptide repeat protein [Thermodesulfobacteriota bacterium]